MALALTLGRRGLGNAWPNPAVGAVVVKDGVVVGRGWTQPGGRPHAEVEALRRAGAAARGATLYATLEPCSHHGKTPPCVDAIAAAGIARVVSALEDPNPEIAGQGHARLTSQGIAVTTGVCAEEARRTHAGHIRRVRNGRPHVTLKLAVSADGKAGLAGRKPVAITGEPARERVQLMRAMNDAVLTGIGTVLADDPQLTCRLPGMEQRSPVRVVLDSALRCRCSRSLRRRRRERSTGCSLTRRQARARDRVDRRRRRGAARTGCERSPRPGGGTARACGPRNHAGDGRGRADPVGSVPGGGSGGRGRAVLLAQSARRRHRCAGGAAAHGLDPVAETAAGRQRAGRRRPARRVRAK